MLEQASRPFDTTKTWAHRLRKWTLQELEPTRPNLDRLFQATTVSRALVNPERIMVTSKKKGPVRTKELYPEFTSKITAAVAQCQQRWLTDKEEGEGTYWTEFLDGLYTFSKGHAETFLATRSDKFVFEPTCPLPSPSKCLHHGYVTGEYHRRDLSREHPTQAESLAYFSKLARANALYPATNEARQVMDLWSQVQRYFPGDPETRHPFKLDPWGERYIDGEPAPEEPRKDLGPLYVSPPKSFRCKIRLPYEAIPEVEATVSRTLAEQRKLYVPQAWRVSQNKSNVVQNQQWAEQTKSRFKFGDSLTRAARKKANEGAIDPYLLYRLSRTLTHNNALVSDEPLHVVNTVAIPERGEKVRVASLHPAYLTHYSRCIAEYTLPFLKWFGASKDILRGKPIFLKGPRGAQVYSADLTAASDWIHHRVGRAVLEGLLTGLGMPQLDIDAALRCVEGYKIVGESTILDGQTTVRGCHMGLGSTWTILSILNIWAAVTAGAPKGSFKVCGDDLVGLWPLEVVQEYERNIQQIGLKLNKSKSYYGPSGVFCEQIVKSRSVDKGKRTTAQSFYITKIGEAVPKGPLTPSEVERISKLERTERSPIARVCRHSIKSKIDTRLPNGPANAGCSGQGYATNGQAIRLLTNMLRKGPASPASAQKGDLYQHWIPTIASKVQSKQVGRMVPLDDVISSLNVADRWSQLNDNGKFYQVPRYSKNYTLKQARGRCRGLQNPSVSAFRDIVTTSPFIRGRERKALLILTRKLQNLETCKAWPRLLHVIARHQPQPKIPVEAAQEYTFAHTIVTQKGIREPASWYKSVFRE
jgi:hypothetical protein